MFEKVSEFEKIIADFYGAPYAVATDCCTHAIELCLIYLKIKEVRFPKRTYLSVPMLGTKLNLDWGWNDDQWIEYYKLGNTSIYDAATLWRKDSYIQNSFMCLSFQFKKHLSLGRGGAILCANKEEYDNLIKLSYDGRARGAVWADQKISSMGYHYYMTPETAMLGISKFQEAKTTIPRVWSFNDYPDLTVNPLWCTTTSKSKNSLYLHP